MRLVKAVADQFARPRGRAAPLMATLLNRVNRGINRVTIDALALHSGERVLDIGFGGGVGLREALRRIGASGTAVGVEVSDELITRAHRMFATEIAEGRVEIVSGDAAGLPRGDASFDAAYTVNTVYFWPDVDAGFREILRVLAPGGRFVMAVQQRAIKANERFGGYVTPPVEELERRMGDAGFAPVERTEARGGVILLSGTKRR